MKKVLLVLVMSLFAPVITCAAGVLIGHPYAGVSATATPTATPTSTPTATPTTNPLNNGLVSYWKLDEASGTRADSVGTNNLTSTNTVSQQTGVISSSAGFTAASSQWLSVAENASLDLTTKMSVSFWVYESTVTTNKMMIAKWLWQTDGGFMIQSGAVTASDITVFIATSAADNGSGCRMDTSAGVTATTFTHIVIVYDGTQTGDSNRFKAYKNGVLQTSTQQGTAVPATLRTNASDFNIGKGSPNLPRYLDGRIDEVGLWNRALSGSEATQLYNSGAGLAYPF